MKDSWAMALDLAGSLRPARTVLDARVTNCGTNKNRGRDENIQLLVMLLGIVLRWWWQYCVATQSSRGREGYQGSLDRSGVHTSIALSPSALAASDTRAPRADCPTPRNIAPNAKADVGLLRCNEAMQPRTIVYVQSAREWPFGAMFRGALVVAVLRSYTV